MRLAQSDASPACRVGQEADRTAARLAAVGAQADAAQERLQSLRRLYDALAPGTAESPVRSELEAAAEALAAARAALAEQRAAQGGKVAAFGERAAQGVNVAAFGEQRAAQGASRNAFGKQGEVSEERPEVSVFRTTASRRPSFDEQGAAQGASQTVGASRNAFGEQGEASVFRTAAAARPVLGEQDEAPAARTAAAIRVAARHFAGSPSASEVHDEGPDDPAATSEGSCKHSGDPAATPGSPCKASGDPAGLYAGADGILAAFGAQHEALMRIEVRLQGVLCVAESIGQVLEALRHDPAFGAGALAKADYRLTTARFGLARALGISPTAAAVLLAVPTLGLSAAVAGLVARWNRSSRCSRSSRFSRSSCRARRAGAAAEATVQAVRQGRERLLLTRFELAATLSTLEAFTGTGEQERTRVEALNRCYGGSFGCHCTLAQWVDVLREKGDAHARMRALQTRVRSLIDRAVEADNELRALQMVSDEERTERLRALQTVSDEEPAERLRALQTVSDEEPAERLRALQTVSDEEPAERLRTLQTASVGEVDERLPLQTASDEELAERLRTLQTAFAEEVDEQLPLQTVSDEELAVRLRALQMASAGEVDEPLRTPLVPEAARVRACCLAQALRLTDESARLAAEAQLGGLVLPPATPGNPATCENSGTLATPVDLAKAPAAPATPATPAAPENSENPATPGNPATCVNLGTPATPVDLAKVPAIPAAPGNSENSAAPGNSGNSENSVNSGTPATPVDLAKAPTTPAAPGASENPATLTAPGKNSATPATLAAWAAALGAAEERAQRRSGDLRLALPGNDFERARAEAERAFEQKKALIARQERERLALCGKLRLAGGLAPGGEVRIAAEAAVERIRAAQEFDAALTGIDLREREASDEKLHREAERLQELLDKYRGFEEQRTAIRTQGATALAAIEARRTPQNSPQIDRAATLAREQTAQQLRAVNAAEAQQVAGDSDFLKRIYGDFSSLTFDKLRDLIAQAKQLQAYLDGKGTAEGITFLSPDELQRIEKSPAEVDKLRKALEKLLAGGITGSGNKWEKIYRSFEKGIGQMGDARSFYEISEAIGTISGAASSAAGELSAMFTEMGETKTADAFSGVQQALTAISGIGAGFAKGGLAGGLTATLGVGLDLLGQAFAAQARHEKALKEIEKSKLAFQRKYTLALLQQNLLMEEATNIFGERQIAKAVRAVDVYRQALAELDRQLAGKGREGTAGGWRDDPVQGGYSDAQAAYEAGLGGLWDAKIVTGHQKTGLFGWGKGKDVYGSLLEIYPKLIDQNGELDTAMLQTILDTQKMSDVTRKYLESLIELTEQMDEAEQALDDYLSQTFGSLGQGLLDSLTSALKGGEDALTAFAGHAASVLEKLGEQLVYSLIFADAFDELQKKLKEIYGSGMSEEEIWQAVNEELGLFFEGLGPRVDSAQAFFELLQRLGAEQGYDLWSGRGSSQSGRAGTLTTMTQEQGTRLEGLMTSVQLHAVSIDGKLDNVVEGLGGSLDALQRIAKNTNVLPMMLQLWQTIKRDGLKVR